MKEKEYIPSGRGFRVAIYVRTGSDDAESAEKQYDVCRKVAIEEVGASYIEVFEDRGVSGLSDPWSRRTYPALATAVDKEEFDDIVTTDPTRFSRDICMSVVIANRLMRSRAGRHKVNITFALTDTPEQGLFFSLSMMVYRYQHARAEAQHMTKALAGKVPMRVRPFGYEYDPENQTLFINEDEAGIVRRMFTMVAEDPEVGPADVARWLNDTNVPTRGRALAWSRVVVTDMLRNSAYCGKLVAMKYRVNKEGKRELRPESDWVIVPVPDIISEDLYNRVQEALNARSRRE